MDAENISQLTRQALPFCLRVTFSSLPKQCSIPLLDMDHDLKIALTLDLLDRDIADVRQRWQALHALAGEWYDLLRDLDSMEFASTPEGLRPTQAIWTFRYEVLLASYRLFRTRMRSPTYSTGGMMKAVD